MTLYQKFTNCYGNPALTRRLQGTSRIIARATDWTESYRHHAQITSHKGRLLATWSVGRFHEDGPGQRMVLSTSDDMGRTWSEPATIAAPVPGEYRPTCITSGGIYVPNDGGDTLVAYYSSYDFTLHGYVTFLESGAHARGDTPIPVHQDVYTGILVSRDGGATWTDAGKDKRIPGFVTNLSPVRLESGRLILTGHKMHARTDDPLGVDGWTIAPLPGLPEGYYEYAGGHIPIRTEWSPLGICEGAVYQIPGRPLRLLSRTFRGRLALSESPDDGKSWTSPQLTDYSDCASRMQFGRLPDGRYFGLNCPDPRLPEACLRRTPLVLALSADGDVFDQHYIVGDEPDRPLNFPGAYKHGRYGYPYLHVLGDKLFIINSLAKEDIELHTFDLSQLS